MDAIIRISFPGLGQPVGPLVTFACLVLSSRFAFEVQLECLGRQTFCPAFRGLPLCVLPEGHGSDSSSTLQIRHQQKVRAIL